MATIPWRAIRMGIEDLSTTFGEDYANGPAFTARLDALEQTRAQAEGAVVISRTAPPTGPLIRGRIGP